MNKIQALIFWMPFLLAGCTAKPAGYHVSEYSEIKYEDPPEDVKVPSQVWNMLEFKGATSDEATTSLGKNMIFSEVTVFLVEKNPGIVSGEAVKIRLPKGGGKIDLSRFITNKRGSFYVGFEFPHFESAEKKKVIFVSRTRKRRLGEQIFGAGCNQFFDITEKFLEEMQGEGIKVNTTQERYLSVLGGTFFFAAQKDNDVALAQVTFTNPQHAALFCEGN